MTLLELVGEIEARNTGAFVGSDAGRDVPRLCAALRILAEAQEESWFRNNTEDLPNALAAAEAALRGEGE